MASPSANAGLSNIPVVSDRWYDDENSVFQFNDFETALSASPRLDSFPGNIMQSASSTGLDFSFNVAYVPVQVNPRFFDQSNIQYHPGLGQVVDMQWGNESLDRSTIQYHPGPGQVVDMQWGNESLDQSNIQHHPTPDQVPDVKCKNESLDSSRRWSPLSDAPSSKDHGAKVNKSQQASSGGKESE